ncbi:hypothetical protein [Marinospirillum sp.]|uniref:hypothetical protein n=1 Tax=Marinospirillum sp. TaxID=2183934 RepID=UPI003A8908D3
MTPWQGRLIVSPAKPETRFGPLCLHFEVPVFSLQLNRQLNTLLLLLALGMISHRVLLPFSLPPLVVHADGRIEICAWHGAGQRLVISTNEQGETQTALSGTTCPACLSQPLLHFDLASPLEPRLAALAPTQALSRLVLSIPPYQHPFSRAPPLTV